MKASVLFVLAILPVALRGQEAGRTVQAASTELAKVPPGGLVRFTNSSGDLIVEGWDRQEVEVTVVKSIDHQFKPRQLAQATERLKKISVTLEHAPGGDVTISTVAGHSGGFPHPSARVALKYHVYAPRDSRVAIDHHGGYILLSGFTGDIDISNRRGDIVLMLPDPASYAIDARNKFGIVSPDVSGAIRHKYFIGEQFSRDHQPPAHRMRLRMGFGGITVKQVPPEGEPPVSSLAK